MEDLILKFQFFDRAGRAVMNMHDYTDRKLGAIIGQMRLTPGVDVIDPLCMIDWAGEPDKAEGVEVEERDADETFADTE